MKKPHTDKAAKPENYAFTIAPCKMIRVIDANVRNAKVSGTFVLHEFFNQSSYLYRNKRVIDVYCSWYEWQPHRECIRLILNHGEVEYFEQATQVEFVVNIERHKDYSK